MLSVARQKELLQEHNQLRKEAFERATGPVSEYFREAEEALKGIKTAAELSIFNVILRKHLGTP